MSPYMKSLCFERNSKQSLLIFHSSSFSLLFIRVMGTNYNIKLMVEFYSNAVAYGDVEKGRGDADVFTFLAVEL